jgi:hypothetical protein
MKQQLLHASTELVLEYKDHFRSMLMKHNGKHPETGKPSLKHVKDKSSFFKELKSSWAARKLQKLKK